MKKRSGMIMVTMAAISLLLLLAGCNLLGSDAGGNGATTYAIGDTGPSGVGIVFHVSDGGLHGLEVAPVDQGTGVLWSNVTSTLIMTGTAIGTGSTNTDAIIGQAAHTASAAQICRDYRAAEERDWFLPSRDELNAIWDNLVDDGTGRYPDGSYWSSSEGGSDRAWFQNLITGLRDSALKSFSTGVRAVRAF